jgi:hypothetical protein
MRYFEVVAENASCGSTGAGGVASVAQPLFRKRLARRVKEVGHTAAEKEQTIGNGRKIGSLYK